VQLWQLVGGISDATCRGYASCCAEVGFDGYDVSGCAVREGGIIAAQFEAHLDNPRIAFDADAAYACLEAVEAAPDECGSDAWRVVCQSVFVGTREPGETCESSYECRGAPADFAGCDPSSLRCNPLRPRAALGDACDRTCIEVSPFERSCRILAGAPTEGDVGRCLRNVDGLYCDASYRCAAIAPIGGSCTTDESCDAGLWCRVGACAARGAAGEPCRDSASCAFGHVCPAGVCVALGGPGDSCATIGCEPGLYCAPDGRAEPGRTCEALMPPGGPCSADIQCLFGDCDESTARCGGTALQEVCEGDRSSSATAFLGSSLAAERVASAD
jgi:hypothetical protein